MLLNWLINKFENFFIPRAMILFFGKREKRGRG